MTHSQTYDLGSGSAYVRCPRRVDDGQWHFAHVTLQGRHAVLMVDRCVPKIRYTYPSNHPQASQAPPPLFPLALSFYYSLVLPPHYISEQKDPSQVGFGGCVAGAAEPAEYRTPSVHRRLSQRPHIWNSGMCGECGYLGPGLI